LVDFRLKLLDELLHLSRIGRVKTTSEWISLGELTSEALDMVAGRLSKLDMKVTIASDLPTIYGDRVRLREILENLMDNVAKNIGDQPEPWMEIGMRHDDGERIFYVRDNGTCIDPENHERIFNTFEKLEHGTEGTGIGLSIVKRVVEMHGGRIWVESEGVGKGATFCFTLSDQGVSSNYGKWDSSQ